MVHSFTLENIKSNPHESHPFGVRRSGAETNPHDTHPFGVRGIGPETNPHESHPFGVRGIGSETTFVSFRIITEIRRFIISHVSIRQ